MALLEIGNTLTFDGETCERCLVYFFHIKEKTNLFLNLRKFALIYKHMSFCDDGAVLAALKLTELKSPLLLSTKGM